MGRDALLGARRPGMETGVLMVGSTAVADWLTSLLALLVVVILRLGVIEFRQPVTGRDQSASYSRGRRHESRCSEAQNAMILNGCRAQGAEEPTCFLRRMGEALPWASFLLGVPHAAERCRWAKSVGLPSCQTVLRPQL